MIGSTTLRKKRAMCLRKLIIAAVAVLAASSVAAARDDEPSPERITEFASNYMRQFPQTMSDRAIASQLANTIIFLEKPFAWRRLDHLGERFSIVEELGPPQDRGWGRRHRGSSVSPRGCPS
jgi:hypothetical protein